MENADRFLQSLPRVADSKFAIDQDALSHAIEHFGQHQHLNQKTRSVHGAAWVSLNGEIELVREDIGRHNAVDKLLGARARGARSTDGFMLVSSRCSYEIIEKAARHKVRAILSISAPTGYAIDRANEANIALYCQSHNGPVAINP
jgi:formate dehydrogenase accessory protein FdhD